MNAPKTKLKNLVSKYFTPLKIIGNGFIFDPDETYIGKGRHIYDMVIKLDSSYYIESQVCSSERIFLQDVIAHNFIDLDSNKIDQKLLDEIISRHKFVN